MRYQKMIQRTMILHLEKKTTSQPSATPPLAAAVISTSLHLEARLMLSQKDSIAASDLSARGEETPVDDVDPSAEDENGRSPT